MRCKHNRPTGKCIRCAGIPDITDRGDKRLVMVPSSRDRQCLLHWVASIGLEALSATWEDAGNSPLVISSGHRVRRWKTKGAYDADCLRRYRQRLPEGSTDAQILRYARRYLAFHSLHQTGLAMDLRCHGLYADSSTIAEQRATRLHLWLDEHAEEHGWVRYPPEPWHLEYPVGLDVWEMESPDELFGEDSV